MPSFPGALAGASIALAIWLSSLAARAETALRLEDAVRLAQTRNERARQASLRVDVAEAGVDRARSSFLPTLVANGNVALRAQEDANGEHLSSSGALTLTQPLIDAGAFPSLAQARHARDAERWSATEDRRVVAFDAARAFLQALTAERLLDAADRRLERARANQQATEARAEAGLSSTNDVTRARLETASGGRDVAQARGSLQRAALDLSLAIGQPVAGPLIAPARTTDEAEKGSFDVRIMVRQAQQRRGDVRAARERMDAAEAGADEPLWRLAPTLDAQAQVRATAYPETSHEELVQLNLTWVIFDAGARYADRRSREAEAASSALDEQLLLRSIAIQVATALASLEAAREAYRLAGEGAVAAQRNTEETEILYQQGLARAIELTDANAQRYDAEVSRETARLAMEQAYLELRFALGLDPIGGPIASAAPTAGGR
jgi:outer membrane protein TolC